MSLRAQVRGVYDLQKLRIEIGLRVVASHDLTDTQRILASHEIENVAEVES